MSTLADCYNALQEYVRSRSGLTVIQAFQNSPQPKPPYIAMSRPSAKIVGTSETSYTGQTTKTESVRTQYEGSVQLWAVVGDSTAPTEYASDIIRRTFAMRSSTSSQTFFVFKGISLLGVDGPNDVPRINDKSFISEATATIRFAFADVQSEVVGEINHTIAEGVVNTVGEKTKLVSITT